MVVTRSSAAKRQTRLTFSPLLTSSPQAEQLSQGVRDRAAKVSIQSAAPRKKRIVEDAGRQKALDSVDLALTPPPTSELSDAVSYDGTHDIELLQGNVNVDLLEDSDDNGPASPPFIPSSGRPDRRRALLVSDDEDDLTTDSAAEKATNPVAGEHHAGSEEDQLEEEDDIRSPMSRKLDHRRITAIETPDSDVDEGRELADDVEDLETNILQETRTRQNSSSVRRVSQKNQLQVLKARREAKKRGEDAGLLEIPAEEEAGSDEEDMQNPFVQDVDDDDFVSEDDDGSMDDSREHLREMLPMYSNFGAEEAFEMVVEWLVHKKLVPNFDANTEKYKIALRKLDDQASTFSSSKFSSSAWRPDFYRALNARPHIEDRPTSFVGVDSCQACGRSSHPATWNIRLTGPVYHRDTLEPFDDEDEASKDYDVDGNPIVGVDHQFSLGKDCRNNAIYAHSLKHWRYQLNIQVLDYLADQGCLDADSIASRESWDDQAYSTLAETIVEAMKADQSIDQMWLVFKDTIEQAENSKMKGSGRQFVRD